MREKGLEVGEELVGIVTFDYRSGMSVKGI
jgi:hypothetical protein